MTSLRKLISQCPYEFLHPNIADPNKLGVIAIGGDLEASTLLSAYSQGLFPWFNNDDEPIAWWSPDPRCVLDPKAYRPSKSLKKQVKKSDWITTINSDFEQVITQCSLPRNYINETWITEEMHAAYLNLHQLGFAHSIEVWNSDKSELLGGLYGIKIGRIFCGESMFYRATNASKIAFWQMCHLCCTTEVEIIDCQLPNDHLMSLGASTIPRDEFLHILPDLVNIDSKSWENSWHSTMDVSNLLNI